jgi:ADP-heptose:LPS heptosyltransferase
MLLLLKQNFVRGWPEYEWRWRLDDPRARLNLSTPWWDGGVSRGRTVVLHNEQGFGDTIQMSRYIPLVAAQGAKIIFICQPPLADLLRQLPGIAQVVYSNQPVPPHDAHCPMLTLPGVMGTTHLSIPAKQQYLAADPQRVRFWQQRLPSNGQLKVGIVWAGQPTHANDHNRSIGLLKLAPLANIPGVWFCSLQKGKASQQIYDRANTLQLANWEKDLRDFGDTAALIANLDLVICVDTAVAHLAGALGKPVWVMLPYVPDWRWMLGRSDSPWYPTMRLFRQPKFGDWESVVREMRDALAELASTRRLGGP